MKNHFTFKSVKINPKLRNVQSCFSPESRLFLTCEVQGFTLAIRDMTFLSANKQSLTIDYNFSNQEYWQL